VRSAWSTLKRSLSRGLQLGPQHWPQITNVRRLTIFFWVYLAQAAAGLVVGFTVPFLYYFGFL
jgi:hypothetical protein